MISLSDYNCTSEASAESRNVYYHGNSIYDSVKVSDDNTGEQPSAAELLYLQAKDDAGNGMYVQAIIDYKYHLDYYPEFSDAPNTLYSIYESYQGLDTNSGQNYRQPLYQDLIDYLEAKIISEDYEENSDFLDNAYDIILIAQSIIELNSAASGYEFLAFNHPDPDIRLEASWNYAEIEELLNIGNGGGSKQLGIENPPPRNELGIGSQLRVKNYELRESEKTKLKELKRLNEIIANDPVMSKLKKSFDKTSKEKSGNVEEQIRELSDKKNKERGIRKQTGSNIREEP